MKHLHRKLSLVMLAILLFLGGGFYVIDRISVQLYSDELSQRLNQPLAMYVVNEQPLITNGIVDQAALARLSHQAMVINPAAEIYLLDTNGLILGQGIAKDKLVLSHVDIMPLKALLSGEAALPIKGQDPSSPDGKKVFSVFPVKDVTSQALSGYLYVVLGGAQYEAVAEQVSISYQQRMIIAAICVVLLAAFIFAWLVFSMLTKPLRKLSHEVVDYTQNQFAPSQGITANLPVKDEIDELRLACHVMSEKIYEQVEGLKENDRLRRELISNVSHDLRTPLASMQGYIETLILKGDKLSKQERSSYLNIARKNALRLGGLIESLFELARLDSHSVKPVFETFPLMELMHDVLQEFELKAREKGISLKIAPPSVMVTVEADISLIERVFENLIANAIKYTPAGGEVTIGIVVKNAALQRAQSDTVCVSVVDTGVGIPQGDLGRVFDRFYRAQAGEEASADSTGLGLAITKRILELHKSEIYVTSELNHGTCFQFDLKLVA